MDSRRNQAEVYLAMSLGLFGFGLQSPDWHGTLLMVFGILFALCFLSVVFSLRFQWRWLSRFTDRLSEAQFGHLALFLGLSALALSLAQRGYAIPAIVVFAVAYVLLIWGFIPRRAAK